MLCSESSGRSLTVDARPQGLGVEVTGEEPRAEAATDPELGPPDALRVQGEFEPDPATRRWPKRST